MAQARSEQRGLESGPLTAERLVDYLDYGGGSASTSGVRINQSNAMQIGAVWACVRIIAETVASIPLIVYQRKEKGKDRAPTHALYPILHDQPNDEMTAMQFRELMQSHLLLWGNCYAEIEMNGAGSVIGLWPLMPDRTQVYRKDGQKYFVTRLPDGTMKPLAADRVFHIPGLGFDGLKGYSPIDMARNSLGLSVAAEEFGARFFEKGAVASMVVEHPKVLSPTASANLQRSLTEAHSGLSRQHRLMLLEEGMKATQIQIPNNNAQFLETRKFQVTEIARIFRVPPHMLADLDRATFSNIEQQSIEFVTHAIRPWLVRWEQAITKDLLGERERKVFYPEHLVDGLLRGDIAARYQAYAVGRQWGWLSADDIREYENQNPLPDGQGEIYLIPANMIPADQAGAQPEPAPAPAPAADGPPARSKYTALLRDVGERMVKRELPQLRKALKQGEAAWSQSVEAVYRDHAEQFTRSLAPVFEALLSFGPKEARALSLTSAALAEKLTGEELAASRRELDAAGFSGAEHLFTQWETQRAEQFAERAADFIEGLLKPQPALRAA
jgi:HK97 family phage portal protein